MRKEERAAYIIKTIKNGGIWKKIWRRLHRKIGIYHVSNKNVIAEIEHAAAYAKLYKKYHYILEAPLQSVKSAQKSNKVWICWFQGYDAAPDLVKACINSVKRNMPDKEVIILSDKNIHEYITFPDYIQKKWENHQIIPAHYSDLLRIELLCNYGGMWLDATVCCTCPDISEYMGKFPLFVYKVMDLTRADMQPIVASNWLIQADSNQPILLMTRKLLYEYWKREKHVEDYFVFHIFFAMASRVYCEEWAAIPFFNNHGPHTLQFELSQEYRKERWDEILKISAFHKLNHHNDYSDTGNSFYRYILEEYGK